MAAFAISKREQIFKTQSYEFIQLSPVQRTWRNTYRELDFDFWVKYGSWSFCASCRSFFFNDDYFKEHAYEYVGASGHPDKPCIFYSCVLHILFY